MIRALALAAVLAASARAAPAPAPALAPATRAKLEAAIGRFMKAGDVPGLSAAVVEDGALDWSEGFGQADREKSVPATPRTLFRLASVSKTITAVAAMRLWEQGKLDIDAPVQKYCPAFPVKDFPVTTRQLLGHLGGVRHYRSDAPGDPEWGNDRHFDDPIRGGLSFFANDPLVEKPGAKFRYTTQGFTVIGCAIEGASERRYVDYVQEAVLRPAGMTHAVPDDPRAALADRASFYSKDSSGTVRTAQAIDTSYKIPGGGFLASAEDMAHYEEALLGDRLVERATRDLMWTSQKTADGVETGYGCGYDVNKFAGLAAAGHAGGQQGTSTAVLLVPEKRAGVVVLTNMDGLDAMGLARELMRIVLERRTYAVH